MHYLIIFDEDEMEISARDSLLPVLDLMRASDC
jgi:hypothetical protein